jgi:hypothetical protein
MGGELGSDGVVSGDTDLGGLRGQPQSSMSWVCETSGWVTAGRLIRAQRSACGTLRGDHADVGGT